MKKKLRNTSSSPNDNASNLIRYDCFERTHPLSAYFRDNHLVPAAGDYEPIQRKKQHMPLTVEQRASAIVTILVAYETLDRHPE